MSEALTPEFIAETRTLFIGAWDVIGRRAPMLFAEIDRLAAELQQKQKEIDQWREEVQTYRAELKRAKDATEIEKAKALRVALALDPSYSDGGDVEWLAKRVVENYVELQIIIESAERTVKAMGAVVEAAKRWAGNNLPQEGECGNSDANILRRALREHAAALSAMGEP